MSAAELLAADDHIAACEACSAQVWNEELEGAFVSLKSGLQRDALEDPHLNYELVSAYVDGAEDQVQREIVESHLDVCPQCKAEIDDLRAFEAELKVSHPAKRSTLSERFVSIWRLPAYRIPLQVAATAAAAFLVAWIATLPLRNQISELKAQLGEFQQENNQLRERVADVADLQAQVAQLQQSQARLLSSSSEIAVALHDGSIVVALDRQGNLTGLESLPPALQQSVRSVLAGERVQISAEVRELRGKAATLLGKGGEAVSFALVGPVGTATASDRPTLRWRALDGAAAYQVAVYDSEFNKVVASPRLQGTEWTLSSPLKRGAVYSWLVTAFKENKEIKSPLPPAPEAKFKVLDRATADEIERAKKSYADSHLILGTLYAQAGLLDEAEREFKALLDANPRSATARKLLRSFRR